MSEKKSGPKRPIVQETPVTEINQLKDTCPVLLMKVLKRAPDGKLMTVDASLNFDTRDLLNGKIETYLEAKAGGGLYVLESRDPADPGIEVLPRFQIVLGGAPKDPRHVPQQHVAQAVWGNPAGAPGMPSFGPPQGPPGALPAGVVPPAAYQTPNVAVPQQYGPGQVSLPPASALPAWAASYPPEYQWKMYYESLERSGRLPPGSSMHSDQLANNYASTWQTQWSGERAENSKLREKLEAAERAAREEATRYQKQVEELRVQQEKEKREAEMAALRSEIASLRDGGGGSRRGIDWSSMLAAGVPIVSAVVMFLNERAKSQALMSVEMRKLEQKRDEHMLQLMAPKPDQTFDKIVALAPAVAPLLVKWLEGNSAVAQAEIVEMKNNGQLMMLKMLHDMVADMRNDGEPPPPWLPAVEAAISAVQGFGQIAMAKAAVQGRQQAGNGQQARRPTGGLPQGDAPNWAALVEINQEAAQLTKLIWDQMPRDAGFHTHEWVLIIFNVHALNDIGQVSAAFVEHLEHLRQFNKLPPILADVFEDSSVIDVLLDGLPIAQLDAEYTRALSGAVKQLLEASEDVIDTDAGEYDEGEETEEERAEETPLREAAGAAE